MMGVQTTILLAIFEYGVLLSMKKFITVEKKQNLFQVTSTSIADAQPKEKFKMKTDFDVERFGKNMDKCTFFIAVIFMVLFNIIYWTASR